MLRRKNSLYLHLPPFCLLFLGKSSLALGGKCVQYDRFSGEVKALRSSNIYGSMGRFDVPMSGVAPAVASGLHSNDSSE